MKSIYKVLKLKLKSQRLSFFHIHTLMIFNFHFIFVSFEQREKERRISNYFLDKILSNIKYGYCYHFIDSSFEDSFDLPVEDAFQAVFFSEEADVLFHVSVGFGNCVDYSGFVNKFPILFILLFRFGSLEVSLVIEDALFGFSFFFKKFGQVIGTVCY